MTEPLAVRQIVLVLDVDADVPLRELVSRLPEASERQVHRASDYGAPRLDRFNNPDAPIPWRKLEAALARMTDAALAHARPSDGQVHWWLSGFAPLPAFALLGRLLPARIASACTLINQRKSGIVDILSLSGPPGAEGVVLDVIRGLRNEERGGLEGVGRIPIFISMLGVAPASEGMQASLRSEGTFGDCPVELRTSTSVTLDSQNVLLLADQLARELSKLAVVYPTSTAASVFIAGSAQLAFLVGRCLPDRMRDVWFANYRHDTGTYEEALHWRTRSATRQAPDTEARAAVDEPVAISAIDVDNFRGIARASLHLAEGRPDAGSWVVLLGENGSGKTTLLRAVTLALTDPGNAVAVLQDAPAWYVRHGEALATCCVHLPGGKAALRVRRLEGREEAAGDSDIERPWVVAYGCSRGGAFGGREPGHARTPFADVATLFDDDRGLINVADWIITQEAASTNSKAAKRAYDAVTRALGEMIGHRFLPARPDGLWVEPNAGGGAIQFASLSDGFLTTAGWIGDLLVRYVERHSKQPERVATDFWKQMTGIVVLDEIDQHLHPRWQVRIIGQVRELFPRMTFIVTTHNPLTIAGARKDEIFLIQHDPNHNVVIEPAHFDPRLRTGTELFAKFFGIGDIFPNELGRKLHRYGTLASNPYRSAAEEEELEEIIVRLEQEGVDPGFAPEPRSKES